MSHDLSDPAAVTGFSFDSLQASVVARGATRGWRLQGRSAEGRELLLDLVGVVSPVALPAVLHAARLRRSGDGAALDWSLEATEGRFDAGTARLFVHEDVAAPAAAAIPPRPVPLGKRLMWRAVFTLLGTGFGRRWLARRAGLA